MMQQQQQPGHMFPVMPSFPATNITTDQIQKYLDENKKLILAILENQNLGKLAECAQYQAQLQKNLMYLAAIADAQPQTPAMPPQMTPHPATQQGGFYMQHPQAAAMAQQPGLFPQRPLFNSPQPMQDPQQHLPHPQSTQAQMLLRPLAPTNSVNVSLNNTNLGVNKQDKTDGGATAGSDGHGNSGVARGGRDDEEAK